MTAAADPPVTAAVPDRQGQRRDARVEAPAIVAAQLTKRYPGARGGEGVQALDGVSFAVEEGELFGFLGPNGAGKTTTIKVLATLTRPTTGTAMVAGIDVAARPAEVRQRIGLAMQSVALENMLTGRENIELMGRLHRMPERRLRARVDALLELMNLTGAASRLAGTYSGGMRRRLDLATALVHQPAVLFLDEPTEGLDPQSRTALWEELVSINRAGTTMFLTTHYMEEADRLCDRLAIVDQGKIVVEGTPRELKRSVGSDSVEIALAQTNGKSSFAAAQAATLARLQGVDEILGAEPAAEGISVTVSSARVAVPILLRRLDGAGIHVAGLTTREPSLDDVFLRYCGRRIRAEEADQPLAVGWW
ncbi:MAG TPA: ATP-binding cassette domain-containing protein [Candidatus Limnocylindria bacterium]|nr:ATP-binding cassette domain-containing protein [Candidatus Limnocylindria bacterium]